MPTAVATDTERVALVRLADRAEALAWADMYAAAPPALGVRVERCEEATLLIAPKIPLGLFNRVIALGQHGPVTEERTDAILQRYREAGSAKIFVHVGAATDGAVAETLASHGLVPGQPPHWARCLHAQTVPDVESELVTRPLGRADAATLGALLCTAHGMPPVIETWVARLVGRQGWQAYGSFDGARLVAGAFLWSGDGFAWLGMAATLPEARRRGAQGALLRRRAADAAAAGARLAVTETWVPAPGEHNPSLANMLRAGFIELEHRANWQAAF